jgi:hypothetical protein
MLILLFYFVFEVEGGMSAHKQALCDNIDAWAMWLSPPVFITFNLVYWIAYRHVDSEFIHV